MYFIKASTSSSLYTESSNFLLLRASVNADITTRVYIKSLIRKLLKIIYRIAIFWSIYENYFHLRVSIFSIKLKSTQDLTLMSNYYAR